MQPANIPVEMLQFPNWLVWKYENRGATKLSKIPYCPRTSRMADVTNPEFWSTFDSAWNVIDKFDGIGFVLSSNDPFCVLDLDAVENPQQIEYQKWIFDQFYTYAELSPSGKGLHLICKATVPTGRRTSFVEIYSKDRFITMTGNVYRAADVASCQSQVSLLWDSFPSSISTANAGYSTAQVYDDRKIYDIAVAAENGTKFLALWNGDINSYHHGDHSSADFALINIISFYTQNPEQIARIFRTSGLGRRPKAFRDDYVQSMIVKSFDRIVTPVDISALANGITEILESKKRQALIPADKPLYVKSMAEFVVKPPDDEETEDSYEESKIPLPVGMVGEIAKFIYDQSYKPVKEIAICAALGLAGGMCGRAWNISKGQGLNLYLLMLAGTGRGKEEMSKGVEKLARTVQQVFPTFGDFLGPADLASGQGLLRYMAEHPTKSFVSIFGEFGIKLKSISSQKAFQPDQMLQRVLLDFFSKSGAAGRVNPSVFSDSQKNTKPIDSPAFTMIGETSPGWFYDNIDDDMIATGLLPRFLVIDYSGPRPPSNEDGGNVIPTSSLIQKLCTTGTLAQTLINGRVPMEVKFDKVAAQMSRELDREADDRINRSRNNNVIVELWNRAHLKTLKVAGLLAIGVNPYQPVVNEEMFIWAKDFVLDTVNKLTGKFNSGAVGSTPDENNQALYIIDQIRKYLAFEYDKAGDYVTPKMFGCKLIPYNYLYKRSAQNKNFKNDKLGAAQALKRTLQGLKDNADIIELNSHQLQNEFQYSGKAFMAKSARILG